MTPVEIQEKTKLVTPETQKESKTPTPTPKSYTPGFKVLFAIVGLTVAAYLRRL